MEKNEVLTQAEPEITESEVPEEKKEPTKLEKVIAALRQYPTEDEAKSHITTVCREIGCARSMGYAAIKRIMKEGGFSGQAAPRTEAKEPTAKVEDVKPEPLEETQETEFEETAETAAEPEGIAQPAAAAMELLDPKRLKRTLDIVFNKIAKMTKYPDFALEENESTALAETWQPVLVQYAPSLITNPLAWAGITTLVVFAPKILGYIAERQKKKEDKPLPEVKKQEPPPETPKEPPKEETPPPLENDGIVNATRKEKPQTAAFMKSL